MALLFEKYMLLDRGFKNVKKNDKIIGFQLMVKISYYRGVLLHTLGDWGVRVDGEEFTGKDMLYTVGNRTITYDDIPYSTDIFWPFGEPLILTVLKPGGLSPGLHEVFFSQSISPSYSSSGPGFVAGVTEKLALVI